MIIPLIICAVLSGIITLFIIAPIAQSRPKTCYALMVLIPALSMLAYWFAAPYIHGFKYSDAGQKVQENIAEHILTERMVKNAIQDGSALKLAGLYIAQEKFDDAIKLLKAARKKQPDNKDIALQLATAYFAKGLLKAEHNKYEDALENLEQARKDAPEDAPFLEDLDFFIKRIKDSMEN